MGKGKVNRAVNILRGRYRPPHARPVDIGSMEVIEGFSPGHLLKAVDDAPFGTLSWPRSAPAKALELPPEELVLIVERGGHVRLWPVLLLRRYHVVNDTAGGVPIVVTFCPRCYSGVAFDPVVDGSPLTFEVYGLYQGSMVMNDTQTGTIWTPLDGKAVAGPLVRRELRFEPFQMMPLGAALERFPEASTPAAAIPAKPDARDPGRARQDGRLKWMVRSWDDRLPPRTLVLGVEAGGTTRAYPLDLSRPGPRLAQAELDGTPIVLMGVPGGWPLAFDRRLDGRVLEFDLRPDPTTGERIVDTEGSTWQAGRAVDGPSVGRTLGFVPSHVVEWYMWATYHPETCIGRLGNEPRTSFN